MNTKPADQQFGAAKGPFHGLKALEAEAKTVANSRLMAMASNETKMLLVLHQRLIEVLLTGEATTPMPGGHHA